MNIYLHTYRLLYHFQAYRFIDSSLPTRIYSWTEIQRSPGKYTLALCPPVKGAPNVHAFKSSWCMTATVAYGCQEWYHNTESSRLHRLEREHGAQHADMSGRIPRVSWISPIVWIAVCTANTRASRLNLVGHFAPTECPTLFGHMISFSSP